MKRESRSVIHMEKQLGWERVSGNLQGGAKSVSHVDGVSDMVPACWLCGSVGQGFQQQDNGLCPPFCLRENCPPALTLMPDTSVPPAMSLVPFKLLPQCWGSERVGLSKSMCGFLKRNCLGLKKFLPPTQSLLVFVVKSYGVSYSWQWNPGLGVLV